jgi:MEMO1 family protein
MMRSPNGEYNDEMIREPVVAGRFYPDSPTGLRKTVLSYLGQDEPKLEAAAVVAPHAGYVYSGAVAGAVYGAVRMPDRFIVLGPNHTGWGEQLSLHPDGVWQLPLGPATVDSDLNSRLLESCSLLREDRRAHQQEHSLEVQIPFLQALCGNVRFAAICVGTARKADLEALGHALAKVVRSAEGRVMMVASSDMNHYEPADVGASKDQRAISRVLALDPEGLYRTVLGEDISMCGFAPTVAVLTACRDLGCSEGRLVRYANSGDVSGDYSSVVGYAGMVILAPPAAA